MSRAREVTLSRLLQGVVELPAMQDLPLSSLTLDSRSLLPGALFLACRGQRSHGLEHLPQALQAGAAAVLWEPDDRWNRERVAQLSAPVPMIEVEKLSARASGIAARFYDNPSRSMFIVGITGTNGKTSCAQFIARALAPDMRCASIGTLGIGFPGELRHSSRTTPDAVALQQALAGLKTAGARGVAMEVSSHALEQGRVAAVDFDLALFTNLSRDHLDYHGTLEAYGDAKRKLFAMPGLKSWVLNLDDPFGRRLLREAPAGVSVIGYGQSEALRAEAGTEQWLLAREVIADDDGLRIAIESSFGATTIVSRLLGRFNVSNLLAVLGVLLQRGVALDEAAARLAGLTTVPGRMERFGGGRQPQPAAAEGGRIHARAARGARRHGRGGGSCRPVAAADRAAVHPESERDRG